jgi:hypothetical protein
MADKTVSDQPTMRTVSQLREEYGEDREGQQLMLDRIERTAKGAEIILPLENDDGTISPVRYVHDGEGLLHRADLKPAEVLRRSAERSVAKHG